MERRKMHAKWTAIWVYSFQMLVLHLPLLLLWEMGLIPKMSFDKTQIANETYRSIFSIIVSISKYTPITIEPHYYCRRAEKDKLQPSFRMPNLMWRLHWEHTHFLTFLLNFLFKCRSIYIFVFFYGPLFWGQFNPEISILLCDCAVSSLINEN